MAKGLHGSDMVGYWRKSTYTRSTFNDYATNIWGKWDINDTEKGRRYVLLCRPDGTFESQSSENFSSPITEVGNYDVENSRVKFISNTAGSMLNGRIFMISGCEQWESDGRVYGGITLISENGVVIKGTATN